MLRLALIASILASVTTASASPIEPKKETQETARFVVEDVPSPEQALGELQLQLLPRRHLEDENSTDPYYRGTAFAQVTGGGRSGGGDIGVGAAGAVGGIGCDIISGTLHGRLRPLGDEQHATGEATYGACLSRLLLTLYFEGSRAAGVAPSISQRRSLWSRRYASTYDRVGMGFGEWGPHTVFSFALGHGTTTQTDGETRKIKNLDVDFALYSFRRRGLHADAIVLEGESMKAGTSNLGGVVNTFIPVRVRYETPEYFVAAKAGWTSTKGYVTASGSTEVNGETVSSWTETIDSTGLPQFTRMSGDVEAGVRRDRMTATANIARSYFPTFDGNLARESRLAGEVTYTPGKTRRTTIAVSPFAARTRTWTREEGTARDIAAGACLQVGRELTKELRFDAIGEAGVSPYARLDGDRLENAVGGQVVVALSGKVAR